MPAIIATDDFNRADSPTLGANWTFPYSGSATMYRVSSNQCRCPTGGGVRGIFWNANSFANDQYAKVTLISFNSSFAAGFGGAVRCSGTAGGDDFNGYTFYSDGSNWKLQRQDAGVATNLATGTQTFNVNDIIEIRAVGTTISGYQNGVAVSGASATDATYASGKAGMVVTQGGVVDAVCDNWEGGNVVVDVFVSLTGVSATPAIGTGTVTIGSAVVTPPVQELVAGGRHWPWAEDEVVYLDGVVASPRVGSGTVRGQTEIPAGLYFPKRQPEPIDSSGVVGELAKLELTAKWKPPVVEQVQHPPVIVPVKKPDVFVNLTGVEVTRIEKVIERYEEEMLAFLDSL